ncbi:MAG TPA: response regulator transcription factor [Gaiellaceae bacterium]|nr:response regulator transcription factor [Gaiellaceae bacterium]
MKPERSESPAQRAPSGRRVLVVDDHPSFRKCVRALLISEGFEIVGEAEDGESALALAAELSPDLILLDIQLPDISGFEVSSRLHEENPNLEIVLVSSRDDSSYGSSLTASGARGFITKGDLSGPALARLLE